MTEVASSAQKQAELDAVKGELARANTLGRHYEAQLSSIRHAATGGRQHVVPDPPEWMARGVGLGAEQLMVGEDASAHGSWRAYMAGDDAERERDIDYCVPSVLLSMVIGYGIGSHPLPFMLQMCSPPG